MKDCEILSIVRKLNLEIYEQVEATTGENYDFIIHETDGCNNKITFLNQCIWLDCEDENLEDFLRGEINEILDNLNIIQL